MDTIEKEIDAISDHIIKACFAYAQIEISEFYDWYHAEGRNWNQTKDQLLQAFWKERNG